MRTEGPAVVQSLSRVQLFAIPWTAARQASLSSSLPVCSNSFPLSGWCHPTISSSAAPFSSCLRSFPASGSFPMRWLFLSGGQSTAASASVLPVNIRGWFPLGWTGLISLLSKGLSGVFSSTTIWKHQFFSTGEFCKEGEGGRNMNISPLGESARTHSYAWIAMSLASRNWEFQVVV